MEKITSFTIDHLRLLPGVYVIAFSHKGYILCNTGNTAFYQINSPLL